MDFPHVKGLARKRTKTGWRYVLTRDNRSITVPLKEEDDEVTFWKKVNEAVRQLEAKKEKTISDWVNDYVTFRQLSKNTQKYLKRITKSFSFDEKNNRDVMSRILNEPIKESSKKLYTTVIKTFFNYMILHGVQVKNPAIDISIKGKCASRKRVITDEEMESILSMARRRTPEFRLYILLLIHTGARASSINELKASSLDSKNRLHLYNVKAKKEYDYSIPIHNEEILQLWKEVTKDGTLWHRSPERHYAAIYKWMNKNFSPDTEGERISPHSFRHTFATRALQNGVPLELVSKLLDHSSPAITIKVYARFSESQIDDAIKKLQTE